MIKCSPNYEADKPWHTSEDDVQSPNHSAAAALRAAFSPPKVPGNGLESPTGTSAAASHSHFRRVFTDGGLFNSHNALLTFHLRNFLAGIV